MATKLEEKLVAAMDLREKRESEMFATLLNVRDLGLPTSRRVLVDRCIRWMEAHEKCNEAARALADSVECEVVAPAETFRGKAVAL